MMEWHGDALPSRQDNPGFNLKRLGPATVSVVESTLIMATYI